MSSLLETTLNPSVLPTIPTANTKIGNMYETNKYKISLKLIFFKALFCWILISDLEGNKFFFRKKKIKNLFFT